MRGTADAARLDVLNPLRLLLPLSVLRLQWLLRLLRPIRRRGALSPFRDRRLSRRHKPRSLDFALGPLTWCAVPCMCI